MSQPLHRTIEQAAGSANANMDGVYTSGILHLVDKCTQRIIEETTRPMQTMIKEAVTAEIDYVF